MKETNFSIKPVIEGEILVIISYGFYNKNGYKSKIFFIEVKPNYTIDSCTCLR